MNKFMLITAILLGPGLNAVIAAPEPSAKIVKLSGDVSVRRGLEENWEKAAIGQELEDIDTILALEGEVVLEIRENHTFTLRSNTMLDIGDLRKIQERELFIYLMEKKVKEIQPRTKKTPLRIGNVSVVHGSQPKLNTNSPNLDDAENWWRKETNGAAAMLSQKYYPNTIVKTHKILSKYPNIKDCGELHFYLARSLEAIGKTGQAIDAYQQSIDRCEEKKCNDKAALERLQMAKAALKELKK